MSKNLSGVRGPKPLPAVIARGGVYVASGTIAFSQLIPIFLNVRPFQKAKSFLKRQFKNVTVEKVDQTFSTAAAIR